MADIDQDRADLNALIRSAHEAMADLTAAEKRIDKKMQEANEVAVNMEQCIDRLQEGVNAMMETEFRTFFEKIVNDNLEAYDQAWLESIEKAKTAIFARFDHLFSEIVGNDLGRRFAPSLAQDVTGRKV